MQCWTVGLGALALSASQGRPAARRSDPGSWLAISYLALLCTVACIQIRLQNIACQWNSRPVFDAIRQRSQLECWGDQTRCASWAG